MPFAARTWPRFLESEPQLAIRAPLEAVLGHGWSRDVYTKSLDAAAVAAVDALGCVAPARQRNKGTGQSDSAATGRRFAIDLCFTEMSLRTIGLGLMKGAGLGVATVVGFVVLMCSFPVIGSVTTPGIPVGRALSEIVPLLPSLLPVGLGFGVILGGLAAVAGRVRVPLMTTVATLGYLFAVWIGLGALSTTPPPAALRGVLTLFGAVAFAPFAGPLLFLGVFLLSRWVKPLGSEG